MRLLLLSAQWTIFILAGSMAAPLSIGVAFGLPHQETAELMQRSFFIIGTGTLLQVFLGHKLQIPEGPAGLWWGVFLIFSSLVTDMHQDKYAVLQSLEMGLLISGGIFLALGASKLITKIKRI